MPNLLDMLQIWTKLWVKKKQDTKLLPITSPNINQLATNLRLNISPRLKHVATLPSEICQKNGINLKYVL